MLAGGVFGEGASVIIGGPEIGKAPAYASGGVMSNRLGAGEDRSRGSFDYHGAVTGRLR